MDFDYIPLDQKVIEENVEQFEESRKVVISKVRFDKGFDNSVVALDFMNELMIWTSSKVNVYHLAYNVAYNYLQSTIESMPDEVFYEILGVINRWAKAFRCAYDHSSCVNFSWAFEQLLNEVKPLIPE